MLLICLLHEVFSVRLVQWQLCWFLKSPCRGFKRLHWSETWRDSGSTFVNGAVLLSNNAWLRVFDTEIRNIHTAILSGQDGGRNPQKMWSWAESRILRNVSVMNIRRDFLTISWNYSDCSVSFSSWCNPETFYLLSYSKKFLLICLIGRQKTEIWTETGDMRVVEIMKYSSRITWRSWQRRFPFNGIRLEFIPRRFTYSKTEGLNINFNDYACFSQFVTNSDSFLKTFCDLRRCENWNTVRNIVIFAV